MSDLTSATNGNRSEGGGRPRASTVETVARIVEGIGGDPRASSVIVLRPHPLLALLSRPLGTGVAGSTDFGTGVIPRIVVFDVSPSARKALRITEGSGLGSSAW